VSDRHSAELFREQSDLSVPEQSADRGLAFAGTKKYSRLFIVTLIRQRQAIQRASVLGWSGLLAG
jgi:hypothetical protein